MFQSIEPGPGPLIAAGTLYIAQLWCNVLMQVEIKQLKPLEEIGTVTMVVRATRVGSKVVKLRILLQVLCALHSFGVMSLCR